MGPRFSTLYDSTARHHHSPVTSRTAEVEPSTVQLECKPGCEGGRHGWTSASRRHVALLETIRGRTSRPRRGPSKPSAAVGGLQGPAAAAADKRVWAKLIARLSRKMGATRLASTCSSAAQHLPDTGLDLHPATGLIRGTSSVLPVNRNPVTTLAYDDIGKHRLNDNNNDSSTDFATRVNRNISIFSSPGREIGPLCVCVRAITCERNVV